MITKMMWVIFYIGIAFAIGMMVMEYFEIQDYMKVCKEYNNRLNYTIPDINISDIGGIR